MAWQSTREEREDYAYEDEQGEHRNFRLLLEVIETAVLTLLLFMVVRLAVQNFQVQGPSMIPTLQDQEYILVDKAVYYLHAPQRGDIVVFVAPPNPSEDYVKRVIGVPGDTVTLKNGVVSVDGVALNEPYAATPFTDRCPAGGGPGGGPLSWTLGPNQYFVMGDNRSNSSDSRCWGPVPRQNIIGKASLVYWPLGDIHALPNWSGVFAAVHG